MISSHQANQRTSAVALVLATLRSSNFRIPVFCVGILQVKRVRLVSMVFTLACTILDIMVVIFPRLLPYYIAFQWFYAATWSLFNRLFLGSPKKLQKNMNDIIGHGVLSDAESDMITTVGEMSDTMHSKTVPSAVSDDEL
jgi:CBS domain containing-hemolysin-like protein